MKPTIIALVGAPGTGKTYLAEKISVIDNFYYIPEPPLISRIVENFKTNERNLETILYFLEQGIKQMHQAVHHTRHPYVIMDTYWVSTLLYIESLLDAFEAKTIRAFMDHIEPYLPKPDHIVWLTADITYILNQVKQRNRDFEVSEVYLDRIRQIQAAHEAYFADTSSVTIDKKTIDFDDPHQITQLLNRLY